MSDLPMVLKRNKLVAEKKMRWKNLTKIIVCGSRKFKESDLAAAYMDRYIRRNFESTEDVVLLTGGAFGVDDAIERYCIRRGIKNFIFNARWNELAPSEGVNPAGFIRNQHMVDLGQLCFAFWDGLSGGTMDTVRKAKRKGIPTKVIKVARLRKILGIKAPATLKIPNGTSPKLVRKTLKKNSVQELIDAVGIDEIKKWRNKK